LYNYRHVAGFLVDFLKTDGSEQRIDTPGDCLLRDFYYKEANNMARITVEDCLQTVGDDNRFSLIHLAVERIKQHRKGEPFLVAGKNKEIVMTLREIAAGKVTFDNIFDLPKQRKAEKSAPVAVVEEITIEE
jgi:DNA-directed RNA polymerase subunit omega